MSKPTKKERRRLKQKQKHKQAIKLRNESPYKRLAATGRVESCKVNDTCRDQGLFSIYALLSVPNRQPTLAVFLVDKWCMGLKDAWGRFDMTYEDYHDFVESAKHRTGFNLVDMDPDEARKLIAAGIRQANELGFRLPANYGKWVKAMGVGDDWASADISDFGKDGKYFFVGPLDHLARHLIDGDVDKFLARPDVGYIAEVSDDFEPEDEDEEYDDEDEEDDDREDVEDSEMAREVLAAAKGVYNATLKWCFANNEEPHPYLMEAAVLSLIASVKCASRGEDGTETGFSPMEDVLSGVPPEFRDDLAEAFAQLARAAASFPNAKTFVDAGGGIVPDDDEEDDDEAGRNSPF
jgi:hypothetical protein